MGGITAALAICAALVDAQATGRGRMIDVSMLESTLASMGWVVSNYAAPSGTFSTAEGLLNIAANESSQFEKLCDLLERPELKTDSRFVDREERKQN